MATGQGFGTRRKLYNQTPNKSYAYRASILLNLRCDISIETWTGPGLGPWSTLYSRSITPRSSVLEYATLAKLWQDQAIRSSVIRLSTSP